MEYYSIEELVNQAEEKNTTISEIVIKDEMTEWDLSRSEVIDKMKSRLDVMREAIDRGLNTDIKSITGLTGGDAKKINDNHSELMDGLYKKIIASAVATSEVNASMGRIVGSPTAGSSGIIPAVIIGIAETEKIKEENIILALFTAGGLGEIVSKKMNLAGAAGGCQAECGVASAMAAGAAVELLGGDPGMVSHGFALALKNMLGLTCDPVAGLVEVPCVKRNGFSASHAVTAAMMAISGVKSIIPADQVIDAMYETGKLMPDSLRETSMAGLATTSRGIEISEQVNKQLTLE